MDHIVDAPWLAPSVFSSDRKAELPPHFYLRYFNVFGFDPSGAPLLREAGLPFAVPKALKEPRAASLTELQMIVELTMLPAFEGVPPGR